MPKTSHTQAMARQWELLKLLPSRSPGITARELAERLGHEGFSVSKRTIERDLRDLSSLFGIACNDKGTPYGWHWMPGKSADLPSLTLSEAVSLEIIEEFIRPLLPKAVLDVLKPKFRQAKDKLSTLTKENPLARWSEKISMVQPSLPLLPPKIKPAVLVKLQDALLADLQVEASYRRAGESSSNICLHPLGLVQRGPISYLVATAYQYEDVRLYAVHRMEAVSILDDCVSIPSGFKLEDYLHQGAMEFGSGKSIRITAKIHSDIANLLIETPLSDDMVINGSDDWRILSATVHDSWQLRWWVLSQGAKIKIQTPKALRTEIMSELESMNSLYKEGG